MKELKRRMKGMKDNVRKLRKKGRNEEENEGNKR